MPKAKGQIQSCILDVKYVGPPPHALARHPAKSDFGAIEPCFPDSFTSVNSTKLYIHMPQFWVQKYSLYT